jgi:hypothetical protein
MQIASTAGDDESVIIFEVCTFMHIEARYEHCVVNERSWIADERLESPTQCAISDTSGARFF